MGLEAIRSGSDISMLWDVPSETSIASYWNYLKLLVAVGALLVAARQCRDAGFGLFALAVLVLFIDDFFELHDMMAWYVGGYLEQTAIGEVHQQSRGEPIVYALLGLFVLGIMVLGYRRTRPENISSAGAVVVTLLLFAFFASVIDMIHGFSQFLGFSSTRVVSGLFNVLEEGGELVALSTLVTLCLWLGYKRRV